MFAAATQTGDLRTDALARTAAAQPFRLARIDNQKSFQQAARERYPAAFAAWQAWQQSHPSTDERVRMVPWLPYLEPVPGNPDLSPYARKVGLDLWGSMPYPSPGPGGFQFGNRGGFSPSAAPFFQSQEGWQAQLAARGANPNAQWLSGLINDPHPNRTGEDDYLQVLWIRAGDFYRPIAAYPFHLSSSWADFRDEALKPGLALALSFGGGAALASAIGPAIMSPTFAAAHPAATAAIGNTVLSTVMNGGDLGAALKGVALSFAGSFAGGQVGALTDSKLVGQVSSAALTAALRGGDVRAAVAQSLLGTGMQNLGQSLTSAPAAVPIETQQGEEPMFASADYFDPVYTPEDVAPANSWEAFDWSAPADPQYASWWDTAANAAAQVAFDPAGMDKGASWPTTAPNVPSSTPTGGWVADVTNLALAALKINSAYQASKQPQPRTMTQAGGYTYTPNANGTVTVRNQAGQATVQRPQVGVPYVLPDGRIITNNGNGTFDMIDPSGNRQTIPYAATQSGGSGFADAFAKVPPWAWGVGVAGILFLMRRRRGR